jgi:folate-binding protein YgfZ
VTTQGRATPNGQIARLDRRAVVAVGGSDAQKFLNDLVTADIADASASRAVYAALLTPQGKILFDFIIFRDGEAFLFDLPRDKAAEFAKRVGFYRLRANVTIAEHPEMKIVAGWNGATTPPTGISAADPRLPELGWRAIVAGDVVTDATEADYERHRIARGIPEGGLDFAFGDAFPHDADMDQLHGVAFTKGCYVGQEVVSRMEHRHTARRRVVVARAADPLPAKSEVLAAGRPIGTLGSSAGELALALVRLDRAKEALDRGDPITAGGIPLSLSIPEWARFGWPTPAEAREG